MWNFRKSYNFSLQVVGPPVLQDFTNSIKCQFSKDNHKRKSFRNRFRDCTWWFLFPKSCVTSEGREIREKWSEAVWFCKKLTGIHAPLPSYRTWHGKSTVKISVDVALIFHWFSIDFPLNFPWMDLREVWWAGVGCRGQSHSMQGGERGKINIDTRRRLGDREWRWINFGRVVSIAEYRVQSETKQNRNLKILRCLCQKKSYLPTL